VYSTRIFARPLNAGRQLLVYGMTFDANEDLAMILPIPVPARSPDDTVRFVDLSGCPTFFDDLNALFPPQEVPEEQGITRQAPMPHALVVHEVGDFEASFVPTPGDFARLDERFRLPADVFDALPRYADWGFAVFKLKKPGARGGRSGLFGLFKSSAPKSSSPRKVHPMAFEFPRRDASALFFPTVHVHDGRVHPTAEFDHELYCQTDAEWEPLMEWARSESTADRLAPAAREWASPSSWIYKQSLTGELPNRDTYLAESKLRTRTIVEGPFRLRMRAAWEHLIDDGKIELDPKVKKWMRVGEAERVRIRDAVAAELRQLFAENAAQWSLDAFDHAGAYRAFHASNERIEPQELNVAFAREPDADLVRRVEAAFQDAIDRATH
jgi:hypothetical protein